ncbi:MAG TPA: PadR family transcriptional regulator [Acidimicrobiales bacterium]|nr:PadR family transcriptional regulator [Acidimicrobiales bacterium]
MASPRHRANPLALAVLSCLAERPMHPYEMAQTMRSRAKHESIRLNYGSLYGVVEGLEKRGLIEAVETRQEGRRPQRTVYAITEAGKVEMNEWLADLVAVPVKEYLQYEAALAELPGLPPDEAVPLLEQRCLALELTLDQLEATYESATKRGIPRLYMIESEYQMALLRAELAFTRMLVADIVGGNLGGLDEWRSWYQPGPGPAPTTDPSPDTRGGS